MNNILVNSNYEKAIDAIVLNNRKSESLSSSLYYTKLYYDDFYQKNLQKIDKFYEHPKDYIYKLNDKINCNGKNTLKDSVNNQFIYLSPSPSHRFNYSPQKVNINQLKIAKNEDIILKPIFDSVSIKHNNINNQSSCTIRKRDIADIERINQLFIEGNFNNKKRIISPKKLSYQKSLPNLYIKRDFTNSIASNIINRVDNLRPSLREKYH